MTIRQIIEDCRSEINEETRLALLNDDTIKGWIGDAIQELTENLDVENEFKIELETDESDYLLSEYIDTEIKRIYAATTSWSGFTRVLSIESIDSMARFKQIDEHLIRAFTNFTAPNHIILWRNEDGERVLRFYPTPKEQDEEDPMEVLVHYSILFVSEDIHDFDTDEDEVPVPGQYQKIIKHYVKGQMHEWLKDGRASRTSMERFYNYLRDQKRKRPFSKRKYITLGEEGKKLG